MKIIERIEKCILPAKLPGGLTDLLQPLDVAVSGPLKRAWNNHLRDKRLSVCFELLV